MPKLVWFRSDLRVDDNPALVRACDDAGGSRGEGVVGVFTICPKQWREEHDWADVKVDFILRNLHCLRGELGKLNIPLKIVETPSFKQVPKALDDLASDLGCDALYYATEPAVNERQRDEQVTARFEKADRRVVAIDNGWTLFPPCTVLTKEDKVYTVYSPFKRAWLKRFHEEFDDRRLSDGDALSHPRPSKQKKLDIASDDIPDSVKHFERSGPWEGVWAAGESAARKRLERFLDGPAQDYHDKRDFPAIDGTSTLSPYLTSGVISVRQCLDAALAANQGRVDSGSKGVVGWIEELIWREFYCSVLVGFPRVSMHGPFRKEYDAVDWDGDNEKFTAWCEGRTGYPLVDAAMRQLTSIGWMHNRLRMVVAMFLSKDLFIDWRLGEKHFMRHLVDGEIASNNGGWQWSASTGTDAQPYFRIFNPVTQSERFDPEGEFIRTYVPELADVPGKAIHDPTRLLRSKKGPKDEGLFDDLDYPEPIVDHKAARERTLEKFKALT